MILGTVHARDNTQGLQIVIDGEEEPTTKKYAFLSTYSPEVGDRVLIEEISDSYVVLGAVSKTPNVHATTADEATIADAVKATYWGTYRLEFRYRYGELEFRADNGQWARIVTS